MQGLLSSPVFCYGCALQLTACKYAHTCKQTHRISLQARRSLLADLSSSHTHLPQDAQHTLHALGLATTEAVHTVTPPTQRRTLVGRKRKQMEDFPGQGKTLDDEVDLHDIDITLPEFEVREDQTLAPT